MSQAGVMPYQQQHAEHPVMWLLRKGADLLLSPLKGLPVVGSLLFKFLEDKNPQQFQPINPRREGWAGSPEQESALAHQSPQQTNQDQRDVYATRPTKETTSYTTDEGDAVTFTDAFPALSTEDLAAFQASTGSQDR
jgi:hypothetical protein